MKFPKKLENKIATRIADMSIRKLTNSSNLIDFTSNDYLGFATNENIFDETHLFLVEQYGKSNGATGSRLISGNHKLYDLTEKYIADFHDSEKALIFNSGYAANVGFFNCVPQRNDVVLYDELCHASIRDGLQMTLAKTFKFQHNDMEDLELLLNKFKNNNSDETIIYVVTESVFSMDGDSPNFEVLCELCNQYGAYLVVDEAHALGVFGSNGEGLLQSLQLHHKVFARIITYGKALGCHGAAVLGSSHLINYLVNFSRSFIYTTGLSPHSIGNIYVAYQELNKTKAIQQLKENITLFNQQINVNGLKQIFIYSKSAIQCAIIPDVLRVKNIVFQFEELGYNTKAILSPTVPLGQERIRFCLHSYNSKEEIINLVKKLSDFLFL